MPIQVVSSFKKIPPPPVKLVSAGDDIFPFCDLTVTLAAIVDPLANLPGHTIIWEQLEGTTVTLDTPTEISTTYTKIVNDQTDKKFKITIDKDLKNEQSDEVIVYATPTTVAVASTPATSWTGTPSDAVADLGVDTSAFVPIPQNVTNPDVATVPLFTINWSVPPQVDLQPFVVGYDLYENDILVASYGPSDTLEYAGGPEEYYVITSFVVNGVAPYQSSSEKSRVEDFVDAVVPTTHALDEVMDGLAVSTMQYQKTQFGNIVKFNEDESFGAFSGGGAVVSRYTINTVFDEQTVAYAGVVAGDTTITRLDPGGIGGG